MCNIEVLQLQLDEDKTVPYIYAFGNAPIREFQQGCHFNTIFSGIHNLLECRAQRI